MANEKQYITRQQQKHDIEANWIKAGEGGFVPKAAELIVYDKDESNKDPRLKIGNGIDNVSALPFFGTQVEYIIWEGEDSVQEANL